MGRFQRSWELAKQSWGVLRINPSLILFPIISSIAAILVTVSFFVPLYITVGPKNLEQPPVYVYPVLFVYYLVSYFIIVFFNAGLIYCANEVLNGRPSTFSDGLNASAKKFMPILGWALISATIGMILNFISERVGIIGQVVVGLFGAAWNIVTFFTIPMLVIEGVGPVQAIKGSWSIIKKAWGETIIGNVGIQFALMLLALVPVSLIILAGISGSVPMIVVAFTVTCVYWLVLAAVGSSMTGIYTVAVFSFANNGNVPPGFSEEVIKAAFVEKPKSKLAFWKKD